MAELNQYVTANEDLLRKPMFMLTVMEVEDFLHQENVRFQTNMDNAIYSDIVPNYNPRSQDDMMDMYEESVAFYNAVCAEFAKVVAACDARIAQLNPGFRRDYEPGLVYQRITILY